ncbi:MAG: PepSY domain-containing protein [Caulobacteraceae bacterium]|nr:PepSY domain-containing protein [Caulobacter sp.]
MRSASPSPSARRRPWPDYAAVWRWHFYAGLFCIPFVCWLALTGSVYLFKPQVEAWIDRPYAHLAAAGHRVAPSAEVRAALAAVPGSVLHAYQLPRTPDAAAQVLVGRGAGETRVWVDPRDAHVLKAVPEDGRLMKLVFRLHGELLLGDRGSILVEFAGSWAVVMILTGLFLWWPRRANGLAGVLYPRLGRGRRLFWRDLHAVTGLWVSAFTLLLLLSGLPWAKSWGGYLKEVRHLAGQAVVRQDWTTGRSSELAQRAALSAGSLAGQAVEHGDHMIRMAAMGAPPRPGSFDAVDRMAPQVAALRLAYPVLVTPPMARAGPWTARSDAQDRPLRVNLVLDPRTGAVTARQDFAQRDWVDRLVGVGVAAHEGQLFGWLNQAVNLLTALSLLAVSASAVLLWLRRRPGGRLGAPLPTGAPRFAPGLLAVLAGLGVLLPLLGASMIAVALIEGLVLRRLPAVSRWLGLREGAPAV